MLSSESLCDHNKCKNKKTSSLCGCSSTFRRTSDLFMKGLHQSSIRVQVVYKQKNQLEHSFGRAVRSSSVRAGRQERGPANSKTHAINNNASAASEVVRRHRYQPRIRLIPRHGGHLQPIAAPATLLAVAGVENKTRNIKTKKTWSASSEALFETSASFPLADAAATAVDRLYNEQREVSITSVLLTLFHESPNPTSTSAIRSSVKPQFFPSTLPLPHP